MRNWTWKIVTLFLLCIVAAGGLYADFRAGYYEPAAQGSTRQTQPNAFTTDATYGVGQYPMFEPALTDGEGKDTLELYCSTCHTPGFVPMQSPLPAETWAAEVEKMRKVMGASIPDDDARKIIAYLSSHYTPETRKH